MSSEIQNMRERALFNLENVERMLKASEMDATDDMFFEACGRVWAFQLLDLLTMKEANAWIVRMSEAAERSGVAV